MLRAKARWKMDAADPEAVRRLVDALQLSRPVARLLVLRGITQPQEARRFLNPDEVPLYDPFLLKGMDAAVARIRRAVSEGEPVLVFGDYDADGVTSTALMVSVLKKLGARCDYYIPNRFTEGYGPNEKALRAAKERGFSLVITVDTGISANEAVEAGQKLGLDMIITDHHEAPPILPQATAIINPKQPECPYPFKGLAGVGVAFKVAQALLDDASALCDLVALGTIADLVPLRGENRRLVHQGMSRLARTFRPGIKALAEIAGVDSETLDEGQIGFVFGPRLNAPGRMGHAAIAVQLLLTEDSGEAYRLAKELEQTNKARKKEVENIFQQAVKQMEQKRTLLTGRVIVVACKGWNPGVVGIVAARLVEKFHRPALVFTIEDNGLARGSARSIEGFDIYQNLSAQRDLLIQFGGHRMAAGMTIEQEKLPLLENKLNEAAIYLADEELQPEKKIDLEMTVPELTVKTIREIHKLAPFGVDNPKPSILMKNIRVDRIRQMGNNREHLKLTADVNGTKIDFVGFRMGELYEEISPLAAVSIVGEAGVNEWGGTEKPQLLIDDLAVSDWQLFDWRGQNDLKRLWGKLPNDKLLLIHFQKETPELLGVPEDIRCLAVTEGFKKQEDVSLAGKYVVLLDVPERKESLEQLFRSSVLPERVYAVFYKAKSDFFAPFPSRRDFKTFYAFLLRYRELNMRKHARRLAKARGWAEEMVHFMADVFVELGFAVREDIEEKQIRLVRHPQKKELSQSVLYQNRKKQLELEQQLCYGSLQSLKRWLESVAGKAKPTQEAIR